MSNVNSRPAIGYRLQTTTTVTTASLQGAFYDYVLAANGLFVHARREGLEVFVSLSYCRLNGPLAPAKPFVRLEYPLLRPAHVSRMLEVARAARDPHTNENVETLFWLTWDNPLQDWRLIIPAQIQTPGSVRPTEAFATSEFYAQTLIEVHTHPYGPAAFSAIDDHDEASGFRLYGVLANIFDRPQLIFRVGVHGHFANVSLSQVIQMES